MTFGFGEARRSVKLRLVIKAIFFDAMGTLFYLTKSVGEHYALVGRNLGLAMDANELEHAFHLAWKQTPSRSPSDGPRENDDKDWWRDLVDRVLIRAAPSLNELDRDNFFEIAYEHFAEADVWEIYPEVMEVLELLHGRFLLAVLSNFDGRLRVILERLGISRFFSSIFISSELGADKPDPEIFRRALTFVRAEPCEIVHVGDDPARDWEAAARAGLQVFRLKRPELSLRDLPLL